jgi:hypothetical protein
MGDDAYRMFLRALVFVTIAQSLGLVIKVIDILMEVYK